MITSVELKQKYIDYLYDMKLSTLSLSDLQSYGYAVKLADEMSKPTYAESMAAMMSSMCACKANNKVVTADG